MDLIERIEELEQISSVLEPERGFRDKYHAQVHDFATGFLDGIEETKAYSNAKGNEELVRITGQKIPLSEIIGIYRSEVAQKGINAASGGHLGYIPGGGIYMSSLGDYLADVTNEYAGMHFASPGAVNIEDAVIDWLKEIFCFPSNSVGNLTSGGSIANLIGLIAARDHLGIKADQIKKSVIYVSQQAHHSILKALRIIGLGEAILREVNLDERYRMDAEKLLHLIRTDEEEGLKPCIVISAAGSTDTGAVDPLKRLGEICQNHGLWFHVDAAYGGFFQLVDSRKSIFEGIEMADSLVVDPHKGLFVPYGTGAVLVKNKKAVMHSHHYSANYMQDALKEDDQINPADVSPELTKHFRGMRIWLPLQFYGIEPFKACLEEKLLLCKYFRKELKDLGFVIGPEPDLSVSYFSYPSPNGDDNAFNQKLLELIHEDGRVFLSSTELDGKFLIRMAILSFRTKKATIDKAIEMIKEALNKIL